MKKTLVISCLSLFLSLGLAGCDDDSNDNGGGTNTPKVNGEACATADECASAYCDATTKKCAAKPAENPDDGGKKAIGEACAKVDDCASGYCDAATMKCAEKPAEAGKKANGEACTKADDCTSAYCDATSKKCADKPADSSKKANGEACTKADDCTSAYCDATTKKCADKPANDGKIKVGDPCKVSTFVEVCQDGEGYYCSSLDEESDDGEIDSLGCLEGASEGYKCAVFPKAVDNKDSAYCVSDKQKCTKENDKVQACVTQDLGLFAISATGNQTCLKADDNSLYSIFIPTDYCEDACNADNTACETYYDVTTESCDPKTYVESCDANGDVKYCAENKKVVIMYCAKFASEGGVCTTIKDYNGQGLPYADCFYPELECSTPKKTQLACGEDDEEYIEYVYEVECMTAENGKSYWMDSKNESAYEECEEFCDKGKCVSE